MSQWTHQQYDLLESAITGGTRISAYGAAQCVVVPTVADDQRPRSVEKHPTTGDG